MAVTTSADLRAGMRERIAVVETAIRWGGRLRRRDARGGPPGRRRANTGRDDGNIDAPVVAIATVAV